MSTEDSSTEEDESTTNQTQTEFDNLKGAIERVQNTAETLVDDIPPHYQRTLEHLVVDMEVLEKWHDAAREDGVEELAGASTVAITARKRIDRLQNDLAGASQDVTNRLDQLDDAIEDLEQAVESLNVTRTVYVVYVNKRFAHRYADPDVTIRTLLTDAGFEDVDDYGLFPHDDLYGSAQEDLAFPPNRDVDLSEDHRTYWTSTSDEDKIA